MYMDKILTTLLELEQCAFLDVQTIDEERKLNEKRVNKEISHQIELINQKTHAQIQDLNEAINAETLIEIEKINQEYTIKAKALVEDFKNSENTRLQQLLKMIIAEE